MAISFAVDCWIGFIGDGSTSSFSFELAKDPYLIAFGDTGVPQNWLKGKAPSSVLTSDGTVSNISISATTVTVTYATAPSAVRHNLAFQVIF